jgi:hypothetical protein
MSVALSGWVVRSAIRILSVALFPLAAAQAQVETQDPYAANPGTGLPYGAAIRDTAVPDLLPDTEVFRFESRDRFYDSRRYSEDFGMKGVEIGDGVYFGEARIAGEKGPGFVVEQGHWYWGFNHQGAEVLLKF